MSGKKVFRVVGMTITGVSMLAAIVVAVIAVGAVAITVMGGHNETKDVVKPVGVRQALPTVTATPPTTTITTTVTVTATPAQVVKTVTVTESVTPSVAAPSLDYSVPPSPSRTSATTSSEVFYRSCDEVRAAGKSPLLIGQPGYSRALDRDGDGIACE